MKQSKPTIDDLAPSLSLDQLRKFHGDLHAVGEKVISGVPSSKIHAKAADFLGGVRDAPNMHLRAVDAFGYAVDTLLFARSMNGHTPVDRVIRNGKLDDAEIEAANLLRQAAFHLFEITQDRGDGFLAAKDLVSNERLLIFDPQSPMSCGGRWAQRTCLHRGVHITVGPVMPLDDELLAVAMPFIEKGWGTNRSSRCAEALYKHFVRHGDPLRGLDPALFDDEDENDDPFPFDVTDGSLHALAEEWALDDQITEPSADALQLIRGEAYEAPVFEVHRARYYAHHRDKARLAAAYDRILLLQLETIHRRSTAGIRTSFETLDSLIVTLKEGIVSGDVPADAIAHFEEMCRRAKLTGTAKTNKGNREDLDKILTRIQALRCKTVDRGCTEAEALLAASKIAEMLDQYGLSLGEINIKAQSCVGEGVETSRRRRSPLDECVGTIAVFCDCRSWYEMTPRGHIRHIFFGLPADVAGARYLYEKIDEAFETETAAFKRSELYDAHPSGKRRGATTSFQAGLGHGINAKLDRLRAERDAAFRANGGKDLVPIKRDVIEDELSALGLRLKALQTNRKNFLAAAYNTGRVTGENLEWEEKIAAA